MTQQRLNPLSLMLLNMKYYIPYYLIAPRVNIFSAVFINGQTGHLPRAYHFGGLLFSDEKNFAHCKMSAHFRTGSIQVPMYALITVRSKQNALV